MGLVGYVWNMWGHQGDLRVWVSAETTKKTEKATNEESSLVSLGSSLAVHRRRRRCLCFSIIRCDGAFGKRAVSVSSRR